MRATQESPDAQQASPTVRPEHRRFSSFSSPCAQSPCLRLRPTRQRSDRTTGARARLMQGWVHRRLRHASRSIDEPERRSRACSPSSPPVPAMLLLLLPPTTTACKTEASQEPICDPPSPSSPMHYSWRKSRLIDSAAGPTVPLNSVLEGRTAKRGRSETFEIDLFPVAVKGSGLGSGRASRQREWSRGPQPRALLADAGPETTVKGTTHLRQTLLRR